MALGAKGIQRLVDIVMQLVGCVRRMFNSNMMEASGRIKIEDFSAEVVEA